MTRFFILILLVTNLNGCVSTISLQSAQPIQAKNQKYGLGKSEQVSRTDHMTQHLDADQSIVYSQNFGGGGAGLGLLLGPLGVAANIKMIEGATNADIQKLNGKFSIKPSDAFIEAASESNITIDPSATTDNITVAPYLLLSKTNETTFNFSSVVLFEGGSGKDKWIHRYQYELPGRYTMDNLVQFTPMQTTQLYADSKKAYIAILDVIKNENESSIAKEQKIIFTSDYMTPRWNFEKLGSLIKDEEGRIWIRTYTGVLAILPEDIKFRLTNN